MSKDLEGNVSVDEEDHAVRKGALTFGGVGLVVGLFAPPLLAATAVGAAIGAGVGKAAQRKVKAGIEQQAQESIPIGGAGLMVAYPPDLGPSWSRRPCTEPSAVSSARASGSRDRRR